LEGRKEGYVSLTKMPVDFELQNYFLKYYLQNNLESEGKEIIVG
jgi:hypothetical protein